MSFHNALCLAILISLSAAWKTYLMLKTSFNGAEATSNFAHFAQGSDSEKLPSAPLDLNNYNKLPFESKLTFTRPVDSELIISSRWNSFEHEQYKKLPREFTKVKSGTQADIFLVFPLVVLKKTDGAFDVIWLFLTSYKLLGDINRERTGIFLSVSDDGSKVTFKVSQIHTGNPKPECTFSVKAEGGQEAADHQFTFEGVEKVKVDFSEVMPGVKSEYVVKDHGSGIFHVEQLGKVTVLMKKVEKNVFVTLEEATLI